MRSHSALLIYDRLLLVFAVRGFKNFADCLCTSRREKTVYVETTALCCSVLITTGSLLTAKAAAAASPDSFLLFASED